MHTRKLHRGAPSRPKKRGPPDDRTLQFSRGRMAEDETCPLPLDRIYKPLTLADDRSIVLRFYVLNAYFEATILGVAHTLMPNNE